MKSLIYLLIILNLIYSGVNSSCEVSQCRVSQQTCGLTGQKCGTGLFCQYAYDNPICINQFQAGDTCWSDANCSPGLVCYTDVYQDVYCAASYYRGVGEKCTTIDQCSKGLTCNSSTTIQACQYVSSGVDTCIGDSTCAFGYFCNADSASGFKSCVAKLGSGENCQSDNQCQTGYVCSIQANPQLSSCVKMYSVGIGLPCTNGLACDIGQSLACSPNGYCQNYTEPVDNIGVGCTNSSLCHGGVESCICSSATSSSGNCKRITQVGSDCKNSAYAYLNCIIEYKCPIVDNPANNQSCISTKCGQQYIDYFNNCNDPDYSCQASFATTLSSSCPTNLIYISFISLLLISLFL